MGGLINNSAEARSDEHYFLFHDILAYILSNSIRGIYALLCFWVVFITRQRSGSKGLRSLSNPLWIWVYSYNRQRSDSKGFFFYPPPAQGSIEPDVALKWSPLNYFKVPPYKYMHVLFKVFIIFFDLVA